MLTEREIIMNVTQSANAKVQQFKVQALNKMKLILEEINNIGPMTTDAQIDKDILKYKKFINTAVEDTEEEMVITKQGIILEIEHYGWAAIVHSIENNLCIRNHK